MSEPFLLDPLFQGISLDDKLTEKKKIRDSHINEFIDNINLLIPEFICLNFPSCHKDITINIYKNTPSNNLLNNSLRITKEIINLTRLKHDLHCPYKNFDFFVVLRYKNKYTTMTTISCNILKNEKPIKYLIIDAICTSRYFRKLGLSKKLSALILKVSLNLNYNLILLDSYSPKTYPLFKKYFNAYYTTLYTPRHISKTDVQIINDKMKNILELMNNKSVKIKFTALASDNSYNTLIMLKYLDETNDELSIKKINDTYSTIPIDKDGLEKGYVSMICEIPDEDIYLDNPNNETKPSYLIRDITDTEEMPPIPFSIHSSLKNKYLKYKTKYLELKKIIAK